MLCDLHVSPHGYKNDGGERLCVCLNTVYCGARSSGPVDRSQGHAINTQCDYSGKSFVAGKKYRDHLHGVYQAYDIMSSRNDIFLEQPAESHQEVGRKRSAHVLCSSRLKIASHVKAALQSQTMIMDFFSRRRWTLTLSVVVVHQQT